MSILVFQAIKSLLTHKKLFVNHNLHPNFASQFIILITHFVWKCSDFASMYMLLFIIKRVEFNRKYIHCNNFGLMEMFCKIYLVITMNFLFINCIQSNFKKFPLHKYKNLKMVNFINQCMLYLRYN